MLEHSNCLAVSFGYNGEIPFPKIGVTLQEEQDWSKFEFQKQYNCFMVFVGGRYLWDIYRVVLNVLEISTQFGEMPPKAILLMGPHDTSLVALISKHLQMTMVFIYFV